jgi:signal transduction histidine kinase
LRRRSSGYWIFSALLIGAIAAALAHAATQATITHNVEKLTGAEYLAGYCAPTPPSPGLRGVRVSLPVLLVASSTSNCTQGRWIRVTFRLGADAQRQDGRDAVYLERSVPNSAVYVNGHFLGASEGFDDPSSRTWNYPQYLTLAAPLLRPGDNYLLIESIPRSNDRTELGPVWIGDGAALSARYTRQMWLQVIGVEVVTLLVGLIGLFTGLLWLRRRHEHVFGLFALSCGIWIVRNSQFFVVHSYSVFYFSLLTDAALFWLVAVQYSLCFRILERPVNWFERAVYVYALAITAAMYLGGPIRKPLITMIGYAWLVPVGLVFQFYLTRETWRSPSVLRYLLWLTAIVSTATGTYDFELLTGHLPWRGGFLMPYSALFYALTVGWALVDRFVKNHTQYEQLNRELEARVYQREQQLVSHYARAAELEREQTIASERDRILRDMHDGLGLHLIAARRLVEKGEHSRQQLSALLGDAMDELRIAIDSMKPSAQDLLVMLGNLRYRLEPRLSNAGISLHWNIASDSDLNRLGPSELTEVTRIVQELCTNAIKHSQATDMSLSVEELENHAIRITLVDNGVGYDVTAAHSGEGLRSIRRRAANLGAALDIESKPGETRTTLTLVLSPVAAHPKADPKPA